MVAGVEPRRVREIRVYQEVQCVRPHRWVVDLVVGEHHVDGDTFSGGRRLGRWWRTPVGAANSELKRGSGEWMHKGATGKSWGLEVHARGANRAGSRGGSRRPESRKKAPSGLFQWLGGVLEVCRGGVGSGGARGLYL